MTSRTHVPRAAAAPVAWLLVGMLVLAVTGCASSQKIGTGVHLGSKGNANLNVGGSTSAAPSAAATHRTASHKSAVAPSRPQTSSAATTRQTTAPSQPKAKPFTVTINGDTSGQPGFNPPDAAVYVGTEIVWVNHDSQPRGVIAQNGAFHSPPIAPGKSYTWVAKAAGRYSYQDTTRPYVDGQIQVYAK